MSILKIQVFIELLRSLRGWIIYHWKIKSYGTKETGISLIPKDKNENERCAILYLDDWAKENEYKKIIIITDDKNLVPLINKTVKKKKDILILSSRDIRCIVALWHLCNFNTNFVYASLSDDLRKNYDNFMKKNNLDIEELYAIGIYNISKYVIKEARMHLLSNE